MNISEQNMKCAAEIFGGEEILICAPFDISPSEKYTDGAVVLSRTRAAFIENGVPCRIIPVEDMHSAAAELINDINGGAAVKPVSESDEKL